MLNALGFGFKSIVRPFKGFWDIKTLDHRVKTSWLILAVAAISRVFSQQYSGYFFSTYNPATFNIFTELLSILLPFALWVVVGWSVTTLMNGEGTMTDIFTSSAYCLLPYIIINIPLTIISNAMSIEESGYYHFLVGLSLVWTVFLLFVATMTIHQYTFTKTIGVTIVILFSIGVVLLVAVIFYDQLQKMIAFFVDSYRELSFRV